MLAKNFLSLLRLLLVLLLFVACVGEAITLQLPVGVARVLIFFLRLRFVEEEFMRLLIDKVLF